MSTSYDDPNREAVGLAPIWTGADAAPEPQAKAEPEPKAKAATKHKSDDAPA